MNAVLTFLKRSAIKELSRFEMFA